MKNQSSALLKAAIITMSFVQMASNGIAPILEEIGKAFPEASATSIQFLMTFPSIFVVVFSLLASIMADKLPKKVLAMTGLCLVSIAGLGACFVHSSISVLLLWAAMIGIGAGMVAPIAPSLVTEKFVGGEQQMMLGIQNSSANIGSMLMMMLGGILGAMGWQYGYLVYLVAVPGILFTLIGMPGGNTNVSAGSKNTDTQAGASKAPLQIKVKTEMAIAFVFLMLFSYAPANLAMIISEKGIGGPALAGTMSTLYLLSGTVVGILYGLIAPVLKEKTIAAGALALAIGALMISFAPNTIVLALGCLVGGTSISLVMPGCMGQAVKMPGKETLATALIMSSGNIGVFLAPLMTSATAAIRGSEATMYRFQTLAVIAIALSVVTYIIKKRK